MNFYTLCMVIELLGQKKYVFKFGLDAILVNRLCKSKFLVKAVLACPSHL